MSTPLYTIDDLWSGKLSVVPRPRGNDWLADEVADWKREGIETVVSLLTDLERREFDLLDEGDACAASGISFVSLPIEDMSAPIDSEAAVACIQNLEQKLRNGAHIAVHCRQSIGRSGLLAASLMVMQGTPVDSAVATLSAKRGRTVPETREQLQWLIALAAQLQTPTAKHL